MGRNLNRYSRWNGASLLCFPSNVNCSVRDDRSDCMTKVFTRFVVKVLYNIPTMLRVII